MSLFKRISATLFARVDESVRQIENHDAVISASVADTRRKVAQAKVRLNRVKTDGQRLVTKLSALKAAESKWVQRAGEQPAEEENIALACLRRRRDCQQQIQLLEESVTRHQKLEAQLLTDLERFEQRLVKITQQRNLLRTRQSAAEVNRCLTEIEGLGELDLDDTFERWEQRIMEDELVVGELPFTDDLEQRFLDDEERAELRAELRALHATRGMSNGN